MHCFILFLYTQMRECSGDADQGWEYNIITGTFRNGDQCMTVSSGAEVILLVRFVLLSPLFFCN